MSAIIRSLFSSLSAIRSHPRESIKVLLKWWNSAYGSKHTFILQSAVSSRYAYKCLFSRGYLSLPCFNETCLQMFINEEFSCKCYIFSNFSKMYGFLPILCYTLLREFWIDKQVTGEVFPSVRKNRPTEHWRVLAHKERANHDCPNSVQSREWAGSRPCWRTLSLWM